MKNAIDHQYLEWQGKPVLIITDGGHGSGQCGARFRSVLGAVGAQLTEAMPGLFLGEELVVANDGQINPAQDFDGQVDDVKAALAELIALSTADARHS